MSAFQVQAFNTSDLSDGILRDPGGGAVLGPIHESPVHRHSRPQAGQLHAGTCGYQLIKLNLYMSGCTWVQGSDKRLRPGLVNKR